MQINSNKNSFITERIVQYLNYKNITKYKFCKELGLSNGFLDKDRDISTNVYANILVYFEDINPNWLLNGKGSMLRNNIEIETKPQTICDIKSEYKKTCELCTEKDKRLQALEMVIEMQKDKIAELQKKKAIVHA